MEPIATSELYKDQADLFPRRNLIEPDGFLPEAYATSLFIPMHDYGIELCI